MALAMVKEWKATRVTVGGGSPWCSLQLNATSRREEANDGRLEDGGNRILLPLNLDPLIR